MSIAPRLYPTLFATLIALPRKPATSTSRSACPRPLHRWMLNIGLHLIILTHTPPFVWARFITCEELLQGSMEGVLKLSSIRRRIFMPFSPRLPLRMLPKLLLLLFRYYIPLPRCWIAW